MTNSLEQLLVIDVETTGTDPLVHQILSVAFVHFCSGKTSEVFIRPPVLSFGQKLLLLTSVIALVF